MFTTVQKVQRMLAKKLFASKGADGKVEDGSFNIAIQDGKWAGQTVAHVHCHIIPRAKGNTQGDGIYAILQSEKGNVGGGHWDQQRPVQEGKFPQIEDEDRKPRAPEDMYEEALDYRKAMELLDKEQ